MKTISWRKQAVTPNPNQNRSRRRTREGEIEMFDDVIGAGTENRRGNGAGSGIEEIVIGSAILRGPGAGREEDDPGVGIRRGRRGVGAESIRGIGMIRGGLRMKRALEEGEEEEEGRMNYPSLKPTNYEPSLDFRLLNKFKCYLCIEFICLVSEEWEKRRLLKLLCRKPYSSINK